MDEILKHYQPIFTGAERSARSWYNRYKNIFRANNLDVDDLIQEARIKVIQVITRYSTGNFRVVPQGQSKPPDNGVIYKEFEDIFKLSNKSVSYMLTNILNKCKKNLTVFNTELKNLNAKELTSAEFSFPISLSLNEELATTSENIKFKFEELQIVLTEKEYEILYEIFHSKNTYEKIGKKYGCNKQRIGKIYKDALHKVKNYLGLREVALTNLL